MIRTHTPSKIIIVPWSGHTLLAKLLSSHDLETLLAKLLSRYKAMVAWSKVHKGFEYRVKKERKKSYAMHQWRETNIFELMKYFREIETKCRITLLRMGQDWLRSGRQTVITIRKWLYRIAFPQSFPLQHAIDVGLESARRLLNRVGRPSPSSRMGQTST